eukprot:1160851-Pelagomonas_calceolata.AAC.2
MSIGMARWQAAGGPDISPQLILQVTDSGRANCGSGRVAGSARALGNNAQLLTLQFLPLFRTRQSGPRSCWSYNLATPLAVGRTRCTATDPATFPPLLQLAERDARLLTLEDERKRLDQGGGMHQTPKAIRSPQTQLSQIRPPNVQHSYDHVVQHVKAALRHPDNTKHEQAGQGKSDEVASPAEALPSSVPRTVSPGPGHIWMSNKHPSFIIVPFNFALPQSRGDSL